jgi:hypothetical protein
MILQGWHEIVDGRAQMIEITEAYAQYHCPEQLVAVEGAIRKQRERLESENKSR